MPWRDGSVPLGRQFFQAEDVLYSARHASYWECLDAGVQCYMLAIEVCRYSHWWGHLIALLWLWMLLNSCVHSVIDSLCYYSGTRETKTRCDGCHVFSRSGS